MSEAGPFVAVDGPKEARELSPSERGRELDQLARLTNNLVNAQARLRAARQECEQARIAVELQTRKLLGVELTRDDEWLER